jgi:hypothetical protein
LAEFVLDGNSKTEWVKKHSIVFLDEAVESVAGKNPATSPKAGIKEMRDEDNQRLVITRL